MHFILILCLSLASHYIFKMVVMIGCYENLPFIDNFLNSQPNLIKFATF